MLAWLLRVYVIYRWARLTTRRYGILHVVMKDRPKPKHAGVGRGVRDTVWARAHGDATGWNITTGDIQAIIAREKELIDA